MKAIEFPQGKKTVHIVNLKFPPDWDLMDDEQQQQYLSVVAGGEELDNIIAFRRPDFIDLTKCF